MVRVLFVCLGNICRSPTAEGVFRDLVRREGLAGKIGTDSCGTGGWHVGNPPDGRACAEAERRGIDLSDLRARQVRKLDFEDFEYVPARVAVSSGGAEPGTQANETVVLPRVHLGATTAQLRDGVIEERPELAAERDSLGLALRTAPGAAETTVAIGATTLRELGVTKDSTFRMWTWTAAEKSWEAGFL